MPNSRERISLTKYRCTNSKLPIYIKYIYLYDSTCKINNSTRIRVTAQPHPHRVPRQPHRQTNDDHMTTDTPQGHRHSSRSETNLIILQVNINGIKKTLEESKLLIHDTHADIITFQDTKLTPKANTPNVHNFTTVRTDRLHKTGGGHITLIRNHITFTTTDILSTINTHNTKLLMVKVHINNT